MRTLVFALLLAGCGPRHVARKLEGQYDLGNPGSGWRKVEAGGADYAWSNRDTGAAIYTDSNCANRYEDSRLAKLLDHQLLGITNASQVKEEERTLDGRSALLRVVSGQMHGVPIQVGAVVAQKNDCVYDLVYISPPASFEQGWQAFEAVLAGFATRVR